MRSCLFLTLLLVAASLPVSLFGQVPEMPGLPGEPGMGPKEDGTRNTQKKKYVPKNKILSDEYKLSNQRIEEIQKIIRKYYDKHENLEDANVKSTLFAEIGKIVPLTPSKKPDARSLAAIKESLSQQVEEKYPKTPEQVRQEAIAECDRKFPMTKLREHVVVYFKRGSSYQRYAGTFYGFGGGSLRINSRYIPLFDLVPETRVKFDKKYNELARKNYVDETVKNYIEGRLAFSEKLFAAEYKKMRQNNEKLGYILQNQEWNTAQAIADEYLKEMQKEAKLRAEREAIEKAARDKAKRDMFGNNPEGKAPPNGEPMNPDNNQQPMGGGAPPL